MDAASGIYTRPRTFKQEVAEEEIEKVSEEEEVEEEPEVGVLSLMERRTEPSRREREELEKQKAHERYMRLQEQGKTEQAKKDLERLALIRQQRVEASKKREAEKAGKILSG
ncbi:hypothetical protein TanjilG_15195 [Lupinus angustifolius]|uniref:Casein kinase substrate phosphoprotein PP28 domain-containing protein n=1 Tax=Lupinus angustifolius TaxID=3871 RepID=A0A1J7HP70_LUPAN|nr:hypothetical protein TanjilG_15195 [Lupinus angustifolius]